MGGCGWGEQGLVQLAAVLPAAAQPDGSPGWGSSPFGGDWPASYCTPASIGRLQIDPQVWARVPVTLSLPLRHPLPGRWGEVSVPGQRGPHSPSPTNWQLVADALDRGLGGPPGQVGGS